MLIVFLFVVVVTVDEWLASFLQVVPCKTVVVMTTEDNTAQVSQEPWGKESGNKKQKWSPYIKAA